MSIVNEAISCAERGWKIVKLWGVKDDGTCECWQGEKCGTPGKHPVDAAWQEHATDDPEVIEGWFEKSLRVYNIGLMLGQKSGVIDIELDSEEAKAAWNELNLGEIYTPTYTSGRGPHRLFKWREGFPNKAVVKPLGIEIRIGNGGSVQSVLPPSLHHSGTAYRWVEGMSPEDVELADVPERIMELISNEGGSIASHVPAGDLIHRTVNQGERNVELHRFAVREAFRSRNIEHPMEQQDLLVKIRSANRMNISPPLDEREVQAVYLSAIAYVRKSQAAGIDEDSAIEQIPGPTAEKRTTESPTARLTAWQRAFTESGLSYRPASKGWDPEWGPGQWELTVVHSDPIEYRLHVPAWCKFTRDGTGNVSLSVDQYVSSSKVSRAVLSVTGVVMLDDEPGKWRKIWDGGERIAEGKDRNGKPLGFHKSRGVKAKLLSNVAHEWPGSSSLRYVSLAGWLYERLSQASHPNEDDVPDSTGRPTWRKDQTLWFSWARVWEDMERQHRINEGERLAMKRRLLGKIGGGIKDFKHAEFRHASGARKSYVVWTLSDFAALESIAMENPETE